MREHKLRVPVLCLALPVSRNSHLFYQWGFHHNHGYSGHTGSACPSSLFSHPSPSSPLSVDDDQKQKQDTAHIKFAIFFFHNSIPFSVAKSMYYQEMVDVIAQCEVGYKAPCYEKLRFTLLEKVKVDLQ
ncbi:hypothetical protein Fmac_002127 [Flemingia macrophylla]|uniref:Uncharacterized protein n=1 Tax=Flemingia macrophylla TaxID=520843 RepID=A0ABD1NJ26_9FABA